MIKVEKGHTELSGTGMELSVELTLAMKAFLQTIADNFDEDFALRKFSSIVVTEVELFSEKPEGEKHVETEN